MTPAKSFTLKDSEILHIIRSAKDQMMEGPPSTEKGLASHPKLHEMRAGTVQTTLETLSFSITVH